MKNKRKFKKFKKPSIKNQKIIRITAEKRSPISEWWKAKKVFIKPVATVFGALTLIGWLLASVL